MNLPVAPQSLGGAFKGGTKGQALHTPKASTYCPSAWYSTTLRRGSTGEGVMVLQQALGGLTVDGGFGPLTEAAVKEFQADAGLPQTGIVDEATWRALDAR